MHQTLRMVTRRNWPNPDRRKAALDNGRIEKSFQNMCDALGREPTRRELIDWSGCHRTTAWRILNGKHARKRTSGT